MKTSLIVLIIIISACNDTSQNKVSGDSMTSDNDSTKISKNTISNNEVNHSNKANDSIILISFPKDSTWVTVDGRMKGINHPVTVYIPVKQGRHFTATVLPEDSTANIRINQIFTPDGKADGPFGRELKRTLHQQGIYKLILAENMMQGDEWKGNFKLTVRIE